MAMSVPLRRVIPKINVRKLCIFCKRWRIYGELTVRGKSNYTPVQHTLMREGLTTKARARAATRAYRVFQC